MTQPAETILVQTERLSCDGGNNALGHPRVFLIMKNGKIDCPYCGKHFVLAKGARTTAGH